VRHCYLARFRPVLLKPDLERPVADAVVHPLAVVTIHADRVQLREPVDLYFGDFKNSVPPASSVGSARVSDPWARESVRSIARSPSKTAQSCDSVVPRRDERRLQ